MTSPRRVAFAMSVFLAQPLSGAFGADAILTMTEAIPDLTPDKLYDPWKTVNDGNVLQSSHSGEYLYKGTYNWNSPPKTIGRDGFSITLSVQCETGAKQTIATGIGISSEGLDLVVSGAKQNKAEAPLNCAAGQSLSNSVTVQVLPRERYREGELAKLKIGAFWGLGVTYRYTAKETGPPPVVKPKPPAPPVVKPKPPAPPVTGGGQYLGCFKDQGAPAGTEGRDLNGTIRSDGGMTTALCVNECRAKNFAYAGTQYSSYCFCGGSYGKSGAANNCDMKCAGNAGETCGGAWTNSVYATGGAAVPSPSTPSLGCYKDTPKFDLDGFLERSRQNTPQRCISICKDKGFAYAGVQYGESCLCGNSYGRYGAANNCNFPCTGDSRQICGGYSANNVYPTGAAVAAAPPLKPPPVTAKPKPPPPPVVKPKPPAPPVAKPEPPRPPIAKPEPPPPPIAKADPPPPPIAKADPPPLPPEMPKPPAPPAVDNLPVPPADPAPKPQAMGDCDGDGRLTEFDARCALEMSVQLTQAQMAADMDNSKDVTSRDAFVILQRAIGN